MKRSSKSVCGMLVKVDTAVSLTISALAPFLAEVCVCACECVCGRFNAFTAIARKFSADTFGRVASQPSQPSLIRRSALDPLSNEPYWVER